MAKRKTPDTGRRPGATPADSLGNIREAHR